MKPNTATIKALINEGMWTPEDILKEIEGLEDILKSRCKKCNVNPDYCPSMCSNKISPKEILGLK